MEQINRRLLNWASILDDQTREQVIKTSSLPFIHPHVALMPDAHLGKGAAVGCVIPTEGAIIPAAVGVDIGCGMIAARTQWTEVEFRALVDPRQGSLTALRETIEEYIPMSAGKYNTRLFDWRTRLRLEHLEDLAARAREAGAHTFIPGSYARNWEMQLGTLGSGNHFIEVSVDEENRVWLFLHSGSRGIGNKIAQHHIAVAADLAKRYHIQLPDPDLAYLVEGTPEFDSYIAELRWAQEFALLNREEMMDRVIAAVELHTDVPVEISQRVNCHHNYTEQTRIYGRDVWLSRKGAIDASRGTPGLIPGSMGTRSYVVTGKGDAASLNSSPHGAGREFSRSKARKTFTHEQLREAMVGIEYRDTDAFIDEIPAAYKDIDVVMDDARDLVQVEHTLRQILNTKGD